MQRVVLGLILACSVAFAGAQMPSPGALTAQADNASEQDVASLLARARDSYQAGNAREAIALAERALAIAVQRFGAEDPLTIGIINQLGIFNYADGRYGEAVTLFERALPIADQHAGAEHPLTISIVNNLANAFQSLGQLAQARSLFERTLATRERALGPAHPDTATSLNNLAALMRAQGQYRQALPMFERALAIREATAGAEHADTAAVLNNLGTVQEALGNLLSARTTFERALAIRETALGPRHPVVATSALNLASVLQAQGRLAPAQSLLERALAIQEATFGGDHLLAATTMNNLAHLLHERAQFDDALALYRRALAVREKALGASHTATATTANNIAALLEDLGRLDEALPLYERALSALRETLGPDHPELASPMTNLASLHETLGDYDRARSLYEHALTLRERALGPDHADTAAAINNLAAFLLNLGQIERALLLHSRALALRERALGPEHPQTATSLGNLAATLQSAGRPEAASPLRERALAINRKVYGTAHPTTAQALSNLADLYQTLGRHEQALPLNLEALAIRTQALPPGHPAVAISQNNLGSLYVQLRRRNDALPLLRQAFAIVNTYAHPQPLATVAANLGAWHRDAGDAAVAIYYLKIAVNAAQSIRTRARSLEREEQQSMVRAFEKPYRALAQLLVESGRLVEAEQILAMLKEDEQFEFTRRDGHTDPRTTRANLLPAEQHLADSFARNAQAMAAAFARLAILDRIGERTAAEQAERSKVADQIGLLSNQWFELMSATERRLTAEGREVRARLLADAAESSGAHSATLARIAAASGTRPARIYVLPAQNVTTFLVITPEGSFTIQGGLGEGALNERIAALRRLIAARDPGYREPASALHAALIAPIEPQLLAARIDTLTFYLVDALRYLPLAALYDAQSGHHLVEKYALSLYTAAAQTDLIRMPASRWTAAGLGASKGTAVLEPLPGVLQELAAIVRELPGASVDTAPSTAGGLLAGRRFVDEAFTLEQLAGLMDGSRRYNVLHFATHFQLVPGADHQSYLLLGNGDQLTLQQLRRSQTLLPSEYDLITLSACETALGSTPGNGREIESLGVIFQRRGAQAVLATLWKIQDTGSATLMQAFYRARGEERAMTKAAALREAQIAMLRGSIRSSDSKLDLRHPYFWASFVLMGNWL